ncbi:MAG: alpha/beta hydrolase, partial [Anaerolineae bacterium]|nr:alpha/beta hydrolase [Anaerolineae bacterium]
MIPPLLDYGGDPAAPPLHLAPANGFVPPTYTPLLRPLLAQYRVVCLPPRALWQPQPPPPEPAQDWRSLADDLLAGFGAYGLHQVIAVGHSFGGIASLLAVLAQPQRFRALILLDPTILSQEILALIRLARQQNLPIPLAEGALRRRQHFASVDEAFAGFRRRALFQDWPDEALWLYAEHGTRPLPDGTRTLTWSAEWEAHYFNTGYAETWEVLPRLHGLLPTLIVRGETSDTYTAASAAAVAALLPAATHATIAGHGHLFPQSAPQATAAL